MEPFVFNSHKYLYDEWDTYDLLCYSDVAYALISQLSKYKQFIFYIESGSLKQSQAILLDKFIPQKILYAQGYSTILFNWLKKYTGTITYDYQACNMKNPATFSNALILGDNSNSEAAGNAIYDPSLTLYDFGTEVLLSDLLNENTIKEKYELNIPKSNKPCKLTISYYSLNPLVNVAQKTWDLTFCAFYVFEAQTITMNFVNPLLNSVVVDCDDKEVEESIKKQICQEVLFENLETTLLKLDNAIDIAFKRLFIYIKYIKYKINIKNKKIYIKEYIYQSNRDSNNKPIALYTAKNNYWGWQSLEPDLGIEKFKFLRSSNGLIYRNQRRTAEATRIDRFTANEWAFNPNPSAPKQLQGFTSHSSAISGLTRNTQLTVGAYQRNSKFYWKYSPVSIPYNSTLLREITRVEIESNGDTCLILGNVVIEGYLIGITGIPQFEIWKSGQTIGQNDYSEHHVWIAESTIDTYQNNFSQGFIEKYHKFHEKLDSTAITSFNSWEPNQDIVEGQYTYEYEDDAFNLSNDGPVPNREDIIQWIDTEFHLRKDPVNLTEYYYPRNEYQIEEVLNGKYVYKRYPADVPLEIKDVPDSIRTKEIHAALNAQKFSKDDSGNERIANIGYYIERIARTLGISVEPNGAIRSVRQRRKLDDGSTIPAGWNFGQFGLNSGNSSEGQKGGKSNERRDGIAYQQISNQLKPDTFDPEKSEISGGDVILCENWPQLIQTILEDLDLALNLQESAAGAIPAGDGSGRVMLYQGLGELVAELAYGQSRISGHTSRALISSQVTQATVTEVLKGLGLPLAVKTFEQRLGEGESDLAQVPFPALESGGPTITAQMGWLLQNLGLLLANSVIYSEDSDDERR